MKERGILLPIFSLPSKYGVGDFGNEAYEFIDILSENGMSYWEILPINKREIIDTTKIIPVPRSGCNIIRPKNKKTTPRIGNTPSL